MSVCYALAIHSVADTRGLQVPSILMIDSPARHIDREVDQQMFDAFYEHLYRTIRDRFSETQVIIVENSFVQPPEGIAYLDRKLTRKDPAHPPLVPYRLQT